MSLLEYLFTITKLKIQMKVNNTELETLDITINMMET